MKHLILLRHANAKNSIKYNDDFDRPLSKRGKQQCHETGSELCRLINDEIVPPPSLLLSSNAVRTVETTEEIKAYMEENLNIPWKAVTYFDKNLYLPSIEEMLVSLWSAPPETETILLCSHNPGISYLAETLFGRVGGQLPTAGWAAGSFEAETWQDINKQNSILLEVGGSL
ncbi:MAG: histidine phosphatase family protein [Spirochaetales bacterium]|nr:histidine phosphatase family protein [Spirochaetales bacterium]